MEDSKYTFIKVATDGDITTITFNRPDVRNAFNSKMIREITSAVQAASDSLFVVFRGVGSVFSAGADIDYMRKIARMGYDDNLKDARRLATLFDTIARSTSITIAMLQGASMGGANGIVATSDFCLAASSTLFSFSEVKLGLVPATISPYVLGKIGRGRATELFISGRQLDANEAHRIGLVSQVVQADDLDAELSKLLDTLRQNSPSAMRSVKRLVATISPADSNIAEVTSSFIADARSSIDGQEGLAAFLEKRRPSWFNTETKGKGW